MRLAVNLMSSFERIVKAASDVATDAEHDPEDHTIAWEPQQIGALSDETKIMLADIAAAGRRLEAELYGICTACGSNIAVERLNARPATAACLGCAN